MSSETVFFDRAAAGRELGDRLQGTVSRPALVVGLPRGGVVVAKPVAEILKTSLDVYVVRKLGAPGNPELAFGALSEDGPPVLMDGVIRQLSVPDEYIRQEEERQRLQIARQARRYRSGRPFADVRGRDVVLVDDGVATGATVLAAIRSMRHRQARRVTVGTPVCSVSAKRLLEGGGAEVVALEEPDPFWAVGLFYREFDQVSEDTVIAALIQ